jgi:hypothetical protein
MNRCLRLVLALSLFIPCLALHGQEAKKGEAKVAAARAEGVRVPYVLTDTKHVMVRAKLNGKGPLNFIIDTGAPALYVGTAAAKQIGLTAEKNGWAKLDKLELEGGVVMQDVKARVEDPFQLTGMNKMNLPGVRYDGILGYTILARYRIQFDFTKAHLVWTKLDWEPPPPVGLGDLGSGAPPEMSAMTGMVGLMSSLVGRRPDAELIYRGFLGVELEEKSPEKKLVVKKVYAGSPAAEAGLKPDDELVRFQGAQLDSLNKLQKLTTEHASKQKLELEVLRAGKNEKIEVTTIKGF